MEMPEKRGTRSLRWGVAIPVVALLALFVSGSGYYYYLDSAREIASTLAQQIRGGEKLFAASVAKHYQSSTDTILYLSGLPEMHGVVGALGDGAVAEADNSKPARAIDSLEQRLETYLRGHRDVVAMSLVAMNPLRGILELKQNNSGAVVLTATDSLMNPAFDESLQASIRLASRLGQHEVASSPVGLMRGEDAQIVRPLSPILTVSTPLRGAHGELLAVMIVSLRAGELLEEASNILEHPGVAHWVTDRQGRFLWDESYHMAFSHLITPPGRTWSEEFSSVPERQLDGYVNAIARTEGGAHASGPDGTEWIILERVATAPTVGKLGTVRVHTGIDVASLKDLARAHSIERGLIVWMQALLVTGMVLFMLFHWHGTPLGARLESLPDSDAPVLRIFGLEIPFGSAHRPGPLQEIAGLALVPICYLAAGLGQVGEGPYTSLFFVLPVFLATWWSGLRAGLASTLIALLAAWDLSSPDTGFFRLAVLRPDTILEMGFLASLSLTIILMMESARLRGKLISRKDREVVESKSKFEELWESSRDALVTCFPPHWRLRDGNTAALKLFGARDKAHLATFTSVDLAPERQLNGEFSTTYSERMIDKALREGTAAFPFTYRQLNGRTFLADVTLSSIVIDGQPGLQANIQDITERAVAEENVRASEQRYRAMADSASAAILSSNAAGEIIAWNKSAEKLFGYTAEEAIGMPLTTIMPERFREAHLAGMARVASGGESRVIGTNVELIATHKNGQEFPVDLSLSTWSQGEQDFFSGIIQDISARKEAARQIDSLVRELKDIKHALDEHALVTIADARGRITFANDNLCKVSGYTREELIGQDHRLLNSGNHPPEFFRDLWVTIKSGNIWKGEIKNRKKDGSYYWVDSTIVPFLAPNGRPFQFVAIRTEITTRKLVEEELRKLNSGLEELVEERAQQLKSLERRQFRNQRMEAIGTLAGGLAHDLNNALAPITMGIDLLKMEHPEDSDILDTLASSATRGTDIIQHLLNFARGKEGEQVPLDVNNVINDVVRMISVSFPKNIQVTTRTAPDLPMVMGDSTQLHQVLLNLCVNARDAMPDGGTLTLESKRRTLDMMSSAEIPNARPGEYVVISVQDSGTGIPSDIIDRIFDPFFTTKSAERGTGLGLSTSMGIMKGHRGFMSVYSQPDKGALFHLYLPAEQLIQDQPTRTQVEGAVSRPNGDGATILFVDDEAALRHVTSKVLEKLAFKPLLAHDGVEGLVQATHHAGKIRGVITDLHMPRMNGIDFVRALRGVMPDVPVMLCSGRLDEGAREELGRLGVHIILNKPFSEQQIAEALQQLLERSSSPAA